MKTVSQNVERLLEIVRLEKRLETERFRLACELAGELFPGLESGGVGKKWCEVDGVKFCIWRGANYSVDKEAIRKAGFGRLFTTATYFKPSLYLKLPPQERAKIEPFVKTSVSRTAVSFPKSLTDPGVPVGQGDGDGPEEAPVAVSSDAGYL